MTSEAPVAEEPPQRLWRLSSWLVNRVAVRAGKLVTDRFARVGVRRDHYAILAALEEYGPASQADLGRRLGLDRSDVVAVLNDLERDGLAIRTPDPRDRRRNAIEITPKGARTLGGLDDLVTEAQEVLLEPLSRRERQQLHQLLTRVVAHQIGRDPIPARHPDARRHAGG